MESTVRFLRKHYMLIAISIGSALIILWTLLRFWTDKSIFDLVGQQLLMRAFLEDGFMDATVGATHYIVKMFFIYAPFDALVSDPRLSLILLTLLINVGSFIGILYAVRSILRSLKFFRRKTFVLGALWLASIAGSVFWIEFANSRNIEVAAGLGVVALGLRYLSRPSVLLASIWLALITVAFFMDPLQVYMTGIPLLVYIAIVELYGCSKDKLIVSLKKLGTIVGIFGFGYILAYLALAGIEAASSIRVIDDGSSVTSLALLIGQFREALMGAANANIRIFSGYVDDGGRLRQVISLLGIVLVLTTWVFFAVRKNINRTIVIFVCVFMIVIQGIYFASGQSVNGDTSRYLIMAAPLMVIMIATLPKAKATNYVIVALYFVLVVNCIFLIGAVLNAYPSRFTKDTQLSEISRVVSDENDVRFYGSMDTALPTMFYYSQSKILPLSCTSNMLARADTFYPKSSFEKYQEQKVKSSAIILESGGYISNYPNTCDTSDIVKQFGKPNYREEIPNGMTILYYRPDVLKF